MQEKPDHSCPVQLEPLDKKAALEEKNETEDGNFKVTEPGWCHQCANIFPFLANLMLNYRVIINNLFYIALLKYPYLCRSNWFSSLVLNILNTVWVSLSSSSSSASTCQTVMAGEALVRRTIWEPSVYFALGSESFHFVGHDISIRESIDSYGALIWPAVGSNRGWLSVYCFKRVTGSRFVL